MRATVIIPARYASTRFPGKALAMLGDKPVIQWVYEQAAKAKSIQSVWVATDDERIEKAVEGFGSRVLPTRPGHPSGTDRCAEAAMALTVRPEVIINVQGDEPFIQPEQIDALVRLFKKPEVQIGTLVTPIRDLAVLDSPNKVKVVRGLDERALYFSRQPVPHTMGANKSEWLAKTDYWLHVGMYGYRFDTLKQLAKLPPTPLEEAELLEQLRWLEHGYAIHTAVTPHHSLGIDTPEDLAEAARLLSKP